MCSARRHVRFTPNSDRESGLPQTVMSALPAKADMCSAVAHVCFGPIADICGAAKRTLLDHFVSSREQGRGHCEPKRLCGLEVDDQLQFGRQLNREIARLLT